MKIILGLVLGIVSSINAIPLGKIEQEWNQFLTNFNPLYKGTLELKYRKQIFLSNLEDIQRHNKEYDLGLRTYRKGINQFTDKTQFERRQFLSGLSIQAIREYKKQGPLAKKFKGDANIPESLDWRDKGAVSRVKDQGRCGSCWAFSATGALEGAYFKATNQSVSFSEQQLVDCSKQNLGCNGGWMPSAFKDLQEMGGVVTEKSYPYKARDRKCKFNKKNVIAKVKRFEIVEENEEALKQAVALHGPIAVAMEVTEESFEYSDGVFFDETCSDGDENVNHAVLIVGYGSDNGTDYWIVKNSWSKKWGEKGYMRLRRNRNNHCHIASFGSYPIVKAVFR